MKESLRKASFIFFFFAVASPYAFGQAPPNDDPCTAKHLGMLPNPGVCGPLAYPVIEIGDNTNATPEPVPPQLLNCRGIAGRDMQQQSRDLWYSFTATGNKLHVDLKNHGNGLGIKNYVIALYEYRGNCTTPIPVDCDITVAPLYQLNTSFRTMVPGKTYLLQVSGDGVADVGEYQLEIRNTDDCVECMQTSELFMNPPPVYGYYNPGTTVHFTYVVRGYSGQNNPNNFHGVVPVMGNNWTNIASQTGSPPVSGVGDWTWYPNYVFNGSPHAGFFYELTPNIHDPSDNIGDVGGNNATWTFQWDATTKTCVLPGLDDLSIRIDHYSDFQSGTNATGNAGCNLDPSFTFKATQFCCNGGDLPPVISTTAEACGISCSGSISITGNNNQDSAAIADDNGVIVLGATPLPTTAASMCMGNYSVFVKTPSCFFIDFVHVGGANFDMAVAQTGYACDPLAQNSATVYPVPGGNVYSFIWDDGETSNPAVNLSPGTHTVVVTDQGGCAHTGTVEIKGIPPDDASFRYPADNVFCGKDTNTIYPEFVGSLNGNFQFQGNPPPNIILNPATGSIRMNPPAQAGTYNIVHTTYGPCSNSQTLQITVVDFYDASFTYATQNFCKSFFWDTIPNFIADSTGYFYATPPGLVIDSFTGRVNGDNSNVGTYLIHHVVGDPLSKCRDTVSVQVTVHPAPPTPSNATYTYCEGDHIDSLYVPSGIPVVTAWYHNFDTIIYSGVPDVYGVDYYDPVPYINGGSPVPGTYTFYAARFNVLTQCYSLVGFLNVVINPLPTGDAGSDQTICPGFKVDLAASSPDPLATYLWSPAKYLNDASSRTPIATVDSTTKFVVKITDSNGCVVFDTVTVTTQKSGCDSVRFYNGFSPNGDGVNDKWEIDGIKNFDANSVHIFNRWGTLVWEAKDYNNDNIVWKGEDQATNGPLPSGTYYFLLYTTKNNETKSQKGWIELTR